jgi:uncharacterized membrane protein
MPSARSGGWLSAITPFAILGASGLALALRWPQVPATWATHWNARWQPDAFAHKSVAAAFMPLGLGALILAAFVLCEIAVVSLGRSRPELAPIYRATVGLLHLLGCGLAFTFGLLALALPVGQPLSPPAAVLVGVGSTVLAMLIGMNRVRRAVREVQRGSQGELMKGYRGVTYHNPEDPRLWVPKQVGVGWTINFAHPWGWPVMVLLVAAPVAVTIAILVATKR